MINIVSVDQREYDQQTMNLLLLRHKQELEATNTHAYPLCTNTQKLRNMLVFPVV